MARMTVTVLLVLCGRRYFLLLRQNQQEVVQRTLPIATLAIALTEMMDSNLHELHPK